MVTHLGTPERSRDPSGSAHREDGPCEVGCRLLVTYSHENFSDLLAYWQTASTGGRPGTFRRENERDWGGRVQIVDWHEKAVVASARLRLAKGSVEFGAGYAVCSDNSVVFLDRHLSVVREARHPLFSGLQSAAAARHSLLVVSSGIDTILEMTNDLVRVRWHAPDDGYDRLVDGRPRDVDLGAEHDSIWYSTLEQTTHLNGAAYLPSRGSVLATLFHQGQLIEIDRHGRSRVLSTGLRFPHSPGVRPDGVVYLADTRAGQILEYSMEEGDLRRIDISGHAPWVQAVRWLSRHHTYLVADSGNRRIVEVGTDGDVRDMWTFGRDWRIWGVTPISDDVVTAPTEKVADPALR